MKTRVSPNVIIWLSLTAPIISMSVIAYLGANYPTIICELIEREMGCKPFAWVNTTYSFIFSISGLIAALTIAVFPFKQIKIHGWFALAFLALLVGLYFHATNYLCGEC